MEGYMHIEADNSVEGNPLRVSCKLHQVSMVDKVHIVASAIEALEIDDLDLMVLMAILQHRDEVFSKESLHES